MSADPGHGHGSQKAQRRVSNVPWMTQYIPAKENVGTLSHRLPATAPSIFHDGARPSHRKTTRKGCFSRSSGSFSRIADSHFSLTVRASTRLRAMEQTATISPVIAPREKRRLLAAFRGVLKAYAQTPTSLETLHSFPRIAPHASPPRGRSVVHAQTL